MRHSASLLASLEGTSLAAFKVARELAGNSRSGLTVRFLSKKLELTEEEIEYILDVNHRLLFIDLTKVKIVPEGQTAMKRIIEGLENRGDIESLFRRVRSFNPHEFRRLEELVGVDEQFTKKQVAELLLDQYYKHPDSVVSYVATRGFSDTAKEIFDLLWQSKEGILPVSQLRAALGASDHQFEQGLLELTQGFAVFELFRFDAEERLVRVAALLHEIRQYNEAHSGKNRNAPKLKGIKLKDVRGESAGVRLSESLSQLAAAIAARPARLRGDGDLFREDHRRLGEIVAEDDEPSLSYCLWLLEGMGWVKRNASQLEAGDIDDLVTLDRVARHKKVYDWLTGQRDIIGQRQLLSAMLDHMKADHWYAVAEFSEYAAATGLEDDQPRLKQAAGKWQYVAPGAAGQTSAKLERAIEETFYWLGLIERSSDEGVPVFRLSRLGQAMLLEDGLDAIAESLLPRRAEFVVQPNFDIVVPTQDMDPLLTVPLDQFAVRTSTGSATVYNLNKDSFTQAVQEGHDAAAFVDFLVRHNHTDSLPRNVAMTLEDWMGGMKRVRVRTIQVIESDDALVMADLLHRRKYRKFIQAIDPRQMAIYDEIALDELAKLLEKDGFIVEAETESAEQQ
ncbi:MAG: hypothetical protein GC168_11920 [Candidatus Hydrogenedens sp.]|nr:hypothetical protein [Candidatus Hydrogenedens sp.]